MLRVVGTVVPPVQGQTLEHVTMLVQCIKSSVTTLENSFSPVECDKTGAYDFVLVEGVYRIYIKYSTNTPTIPLGTCGVVEGMPEELDLNNLLTNFTPQIPDYLQELDDKWEDTWQEFINDNNTQHSSINNSIALGDAKVIEDMSVYVNDVTGQQGAALREEIAVGDTGVYNESKAYTDAQGTQLASDITQVANDVSTVSQELVAYKDSAGNSFSEIDNRITTNEAELGSTISAQVEAETGAMQLRIEDVIATGNAEIAQSISIIENGLGETQAAWQIVATVDDLTSAIGMTNDGVNSEIFMHANALKFVDPQDTSRSLDPIFEIQDGLVFMRSSFIRELGATTITSDEIRSPVFNNSQGFKLHSSGLAEFKNIDARGHIRAVTMEFVTPESIPASIDNQYSDPAGSASAAEQAAKVHAEAQANLAQVTAEAYADGIVSEEEARAIADAQAKADIAEANAKAASDPLGSATAAELAAKAHADAAANLAEVTASAYADGIVSDEEARAIQDAQEKADAAETKAKEYADAIEVGGVNLFDNSKELGFNESFKYNSSDTYKDFTIARATLATGPYLDFVVNTRVDVSESLTYTLSFYARSNIDGVILNSYFYNPNTTTSMINSQGGSTASDDGVSALNLSNEWARYWITWTQSEIAENKDVIVGRTKTVGATLEICGVKFEEGAKATPWTASPLDVQEEAKKNTEERIYPDQSPLQISGGGYADNSNQGWGIHSNGYAEFLGGLNTKGATIEGATIIGADIYAGNILYHIDYNMDGGDDDVRYYDHADVPLSARSSYDASGQLTAYSGSNVSIILPVSSCLERRGSVNSNRFRWGKIRNNAMRVLKSGSGVRYIGYVQVRISLVDPNGVVNEQTGWVKHNNPSANRDYTTNVSIGQLNFAMKTTWSYEYDTNLGYISRLDSFGVSNEACAQFGDLNNDNLCGSIKIEIAANANSFYPLNLTWVAEVDNDNFPA